MRVIFHWNYVLIAVSLLFYLRGVTNAPMLQPVFWSFIFLFIHFCSKLKKRGVLKSTSVFFLFIAFALSLQILLQDYFYTLRYGLLNEIARLVFPFICSVICAEYYFSLNHESKRKLLLFIGYIFVLIIWTDLLYRLFINSGIFPSVSRYDLKFGGLVFSDSNFMGVIGVILYFYSKLFLLSNRVIYISSVVFMVYSFSFAVYFAILLFLIWSYLSNTLRLLSLVASIIAIPSAFGVLSLDGSFALKLEIAKSFLAFLGEADFHQLLFGLGYGNFKSIFGGGSHSLFGLTVEGGLLFFVIFSSLLYFGARFCSGYLFGSIFVIGLFSLFPIAYFSLLWFLLAISSDFTNSGNILIKKNEDLQNS